MSGVDNYGMQRWVSFFNDSGEEIPPYGVLSIVTDHDYASDINKYKRLRVVKFTDSDDNQRTQDRNLYALNSSLKVKPGKYGKCTFAIDGPAWARTDQTQDDDYPGWVGCECGPRDEEWHVSVGFPGFTMLARPEYSKKRVLVIQQPTERFLVQYSPEETTCLGPRDRGGIVSEGPGLRGFYPIGPTFRNGSLKYEVTLSARDLNGVLMPGQWTWATRKAVVGSSELRVKYFAETGGFTAFLGTSQTEGTLIDVRINGTNHDPIECLGGVYVPSGTTVHACLQSMGGLNGSGGINGNNVIFHITNFGCGN